MPLTGKKSTMFHYITAEADYKQPPDTDAGAVAPAGFVLDKFRVLLWLGDMRSGFCWFAENMENWRITDEKAIQVLEPENKGTRLLRIKLGDKQFLLKDEWKLVFGIQATPTRPRKEDFRALQRGHRHAQRLHELGPLRGHVGMGEQGAGAGVPLHEPRIEEGRGTLRHGRHTSKAVSQQRNSVHIHGFIP